MLKNIPVKINADKSITANYPYKIYQGEINTVRFIIDPSLVISDTSNVVGYIGFKRIDNQKSGFVSLKKEQDGTFTYIIKDYWTLNLVGKVWYTIKFVSVSGDNQLEYQLYAGNSSFVVNPVADYIIGDDLPPDISSTLQLQIENLQEQIDDANANIGNKLNKEFNTYPKLDWDTVENSDIVALNRINQDGTVTQYYAEAEDLYNSVNNIKPDEDGNIELNGENINVSSTNNNTIDEELDLKVNISEPLVYYQDSSLPIQEPMISVYSAEIADRAIADGNGNNIINTYSTKNEVNNLNDSLSQDISNAQTQITNLSNSISQNYATKTELTNGLNGKQDTITAGTGIEILNNIISSTVEGVKSELVYSGDISSSWVDFQSVPTFNPKHYIIEYAGNQHYGSQIIRPDQSFDLQFADLSENQGGENVIYNINFYTIICSISSSNQCRGYITNKSMYYNYADGYSFNTETYGITVRIYAINL